MTILEEDNRRVSISARRMILLEEGLHFLSSPQNYESTDFIEYVRKCPDDMMPTVIEAWGIALAEVTKGGSSKYWGASKNYAESINGLLREHRISFELIDGEIVPFSSQELHVEVVAPTLRLLSADASWQPVEVAYTNALRELASGDAADAITDAGTALQEALTLLGCSGNALGPLVKSARAKGVFGPHDSPLIDSLVKTGDWISADRNTNGDSHNAGKVTHDDAWLIVHVVGAFLLRISKQVPRVKGAA